MSFAPGHEPHGFKDSRHVLIPEDIEVAAVQVSRRRCPAGHELDAYEPSHEGDWYCNACDDPGGCKSGITGFGQTQGMRRMRCAECDYDLCEKCFGAETTPCLVQKKYVSIPKYEYRERVVEVPQSVEQEVLVQVPQTCVVEMERHVPLKQVETIPKEVRVPVVEAHTVEKPVTQAVVEEQLVEVESSSLVLVAELIKEVPVNITEKIPKEVPKPVVELKEKHVEVPHVDVVERVVEIPEVEYMEVITEMPKIEKVYVDKEVPVPQIQYVEKIVEVPYIIKRDRIIEVPEVEIREIIKHVPKVTVEYVNKEVPSASLMYDHKVVEAPTVLREEHPIEVPQALLAERMVQIPRPSYQDVGKEIPKYQMHYEKKEVEVPQVIYAHRPVEDHQVQYIDLKREVISPAKHLSSSPRMAEAMAAARQPLQDAVFSSRPQAGDEAIRAYKAKMAQSSHLKDVARAGSAPGEQDDAISGRQLDTGSAVASTAQVEPQHVTQRSIVGPLSKQPEAPALVLRNPNTLQHDRELPNAKMREALFEQAQANRMRFESFLQSCDNEAVKQLRYDA